jgi:hypothetical protein
VIALTLAVPRAAVAQVGLAIVDISLEGDLVTDTIDEISHAIEAGIAAPGVTIVMPDVVAETLRQAGLETQCVEGACLSEVGALVSVEALMRAHVVQDGQHYGIRLELLLARDGSRLGLSTTTCDVCNWTEGLAAITRAASELRGSMPGVIVVSATPAEVTVTIDGREVARSGGVAVAPGEHVLVATAAGRPRESREIAVAAGQATNVAFDLSSAGGPRPTQPLRIAGWVAGGLALATLVPGVVWLSIDGDCPAGTANAAGLCPEVYDTWREGVALTVVSGSLAVASVVLFVVAWRRGRRAQTPAVTAGVVPARGGGLISLGGAF